VLHAAHRLGLERVGTIQGAAPRDRRGLAVFGIALRAARVPLGGSEAGSVSASRGLRAAGLRAAGAERPTEAADLFDLKDVLWPMAAGVLEEAALWLNNSSPATLGSRGVSTLPASFGRHSMQSHHSRSPSARPPGAGCPCGRWGARAGVRQQADVEAGPAYSR